MRQKGKLCVKKVRNVDRGKYRINLCIWEGKMSWNSYEKKYPVSKIHSAKGAQGAGSNFPFEHKCIKRKFK